MEDYEKFKEGFIEYREANQFRSLSNEGGLSRFSGLHSLVDRAELQLSICYARDVTDFANEMESILQEHYEAVHQDDRKSAYVQIEKMDDGPREIVTLKEVFKRYVERSNGEFDSLVVWGCRFATLALMKAAEAIELEDEVMAADAAIDAMDAVGFAEIIEMQWAAGRTTQERNSARIELIDADRIHKEEFAAKKLVLSKAGAKGGANRGEKLKPLKEWASSEARKRKGTAAEIARSLCFILPENFKELDVASVERLMADEIRADRRKTNS